MKQRLAALAAAVALVICLTGCSAGNESEDTNSAAPSPTTSVIPSDNLPQNDANEGGGAGGQDQHGADGLDGVAEGVEQILPGALPLDEEGEDEGVNAGSGSSLGSGGPAQQNGADDNQHGADGRICDSAA